MWTPHDNPRVGTASWIGSKNEIELHSLNGGSRVSSGSIVSDYGLYDRAFGDRSLAGAK
jgi:hypothetical protein